MLQGCGDQFGGGIQIRQGPVCALCQGLKTGIGLGQQRVDLFFQLLRYQKPDQQQNGCRSTQQGGGLGNFPQRKIDVVFAVEPGFGDAPLVGQGEKMDGIGSNQGGHATEHPLPRQYQRDIDVAKADGHYQIANRYPQ